MQKYFFIPKSRYKFVSTKTENETKTFLQADKVSDLLIQYSEIE